MLDLSRQYSQIREEILSAVERVCASQHFILGEEVSALEKDVAAYTGAVDGVACASGTDALWLALLAAGVQPGDAVVTTAFSFFASASSIARIGTRPVFADIDRQSFNLDPASLAAKLKAHGSRVRAILPVHLYGQCADWTRLPRWPRNSTFPLSRTQRKRSARLGESEGRIAWAGGSIQFLSDKEFERVWRCWYGDHS